jgi:hypothetical protein
MSLEVPLALVKASVLSTSNLISFAGLKSKKSDIG